MVQQLEIPFPGGTLADQLRLPFTQEDRYYNNIVENSRRLHEVTEKITVLLLKLPQEER